VAGFAGSHGFDITDGDGIPFDDGPAARFASLLPLLDRIEERLRARFDEATGVIVERKRFGVATHYRTAPGAAEEVREVAGRFADEQPDLKLLEGKAVAEIRPAAEWDKGKALEWLARHLGPVTGVMYVGDDTTDEDAFRAVGNGGAGILVADEPRPSAASFRVDGPDEVRHLLDRLATRYGA
jgi:trehalose-phosphatase